MDFNIRTCLGLVLLTFFVITFWYFGIIFSAVIVIIASSIWYFTTNENIRKAENFNISDTTSVENKVKSKTTKNLETLNINDKEKKEETKDVYEYSRDIGTTNITDTERLSPEGIESNVAFKNRKTRTDNKNDVRNVIGDQDECYEEEFSDQCEDQIGVPMPQANIIVEKQELDLLLIGKTGHGKSATANSIARAERFNTSSGGTSDTYDVQELWTEIEEFSIHVVDAPGVAETRLDSVKATEKACFDMAKAMARCLNGFHALLLVLKYGARFTTEEQQSISMLKNIFGDNIVSDYCIVIMTHGDCFDIDMRNKKFQNFTEYLRVQKGSLKHLLNECKYRCVLFRNYTEDEKQKRDQVIELLQKVRALKHREVRYTNSLFEDVKIKREKIIVKAKVPELQERITKESGLMIDHLSRLEITEENLETIDSDLDRIRDKVQHLMCTIQDEDKETGELNFLMVELKKVELFIEKVKTAKEEKKSDMTNRLLLDRQHKLDVEEMLRKQAEEKHELSEKLRNANEEEKMEIIKQMQDNEKAANDRMQHMANEFNQQLKNLQKESDEKQQKTMQYLKEAHAEQMQKMQQTFAELQASKETELKKVIEELKAQIEQAQLKGHSRQIYPNKVEIKCVNPGGKCINIVIDKHEPLEIVMKEYCSQCKEDLKKMYFYYDLKLIKPDNTADKLGLENGDQIDVYDYQIGGMLI